MGKLAKQSLGVADMEVKTEIITHDHMEEIRLWWKKRGWEEVDGRILPVGFICSVDGENVFAAWLYHDHSAHFGMIEWGVSNPDSKSEKRSVAFNALIEKMVEEARERGVLVLMTTTNNEKLCSRFIDAGFLVADKQVAILSRSTKCQ